MLNVAKSAGVLLLAALLAGCQTAGDPRQPGGFSFAPGATAITETTALVWTRTDGKRESFVEFSERSDFADAHTTPVIAVTSETDFTATHLLTELKPDTEYFYRGLVRDGSARGGALRGEVGRFRTPARSPRPFRFAVSGDMRADHQPFTLFDRIAEMKPDFFVLLGDTVYADYPRRAFSPTLGHYRYKHRENRADGPLQAFLKTVPVYAIWDDHEVDNDFNSAYGAPIAYGRQAFREYWPTGIDDETILYRKFSWSPLADFFILDTRQYRSAETDATGTKPGVTMLGERQKRWFLDALSASTAPFKFVFTSVPFHAGRDPDKWGGFAAERKEIETHIIRNRIGGVVMISADIHRAADNSRGLVPEYIVGPIAVGMGCGGKQLFESRGLFFMCDSFNYLLVDLRMENGKPAAVVRYFDIDNKVRHEARFSAEDISRPIEEPVAPGRGPGS